MKRMSDAQITGLKVFEDDACIVLWCKGLFGLTGHPLFAKIYIHDKARGGAVLLQGVERAHLMDVLLYFKQHNKTIIDLAKAGFFDEFTRAVLTGKEYAIWKYYFSQSARTIAEQFLCEVR